MDTIKTKGILRSLSVRITSGFKKAGLSDSAVFATDGQRHWIIQYGHCVHACLRARLIPLSIAHTVLLARFVTLLLLSSLFLFAVPPAHADGNCPMLTGPTDQTDNDGDEVGNLCDNCLSVPNSDQRDTNADGFGNICDADFNQDLLVNLSDFSLFRSAFGTTDPDADLNGDGLVNLSDFSLVRAMFGSAPGPSGFTPQIISPQAGDTINAETVNIIGIFANESNSGINVNGETACAYNNNFYINNLPLTTGANTLTATYTTQNGNTLNTAINVTQSGAANYKFTSDQNCGLAPLNATFNLDAGSNIIQQLDIDYDADGTIDLSTTTPATVTLQHNYTAAGVYPATVWVTSGGVIEQLSLNIVVKDETQQDDMFQALWSGMWSALKAGDKAAAIQYLTPEGVRAYGGIFDSLMPHMTETFDELSVIEPVESNTETADYAVIRLENGVIKTFMINYSRGNDGVWRIDSM